MEKESKDSFSCSFFISVFNDERKFAFASKFKSISFLIIRTCLY